MVGFQYRFHPGLRIVKQLVDDGAIGRVIHAQAHWGEYLPAWHPWEDYRQSYSARADLGGGVILNVPIFGQPLPISITWTEAVQSEEGDRLQQFSFDLGWFLH